jgi:hypothetical protein
MQILFTNFLFAPEHAIKLRPYFDMILSMIYILPATLESSTSHISISELYIVGV